MPRLAAWGRMAFILSSERTMVEQAGLSRLRWMASNSQRVVHRPQPMQRLASTMEAPQPRQRAVSFLTCSYVKVWRTSVQSCKTDVTWSQAGT